MLIVSRHSLRLIHAFAIIHISLKIGGLRLRLPSFFSVQRVRQNCVAMSAALPIHEAQHHCAGCTAIEAYLARILLLLVDGFRATKEGG
jgi:hypothetical protein